MALDYWTDYYARNPNSSVDEFENPDFEADVAAMMAADGPLPQASDPVGDDDDDWEIIE